MTPHKAPVTARDTPTTHDLRGRWGYPMGEDHITIPLTRLPGVEGSGTDHLIAANVVTSAATPATDCWDKALAWIALAVHIETRPAEADVEALAALITATATHDTHRLAVALLRAGVTPPPPAAAAEAPPTPTIRVIA